jgi:hypothetical protein
MTSWYSWSESDTSQTDQANKQVRLAVQKIIIILHESKRGDSPFHSEAVSFVIIRKIEKEGRKTEASLVFKNKLYCRSTLTLSQALNGTHMGR